MSRRVYNKRVRLGSYYDMNVNYNGKIIKHTDLKLVKVTSKGYNFLDVEINKVLYFKSHYYRYKNDFLKGDDLMTRRWNGKEHIDVLLKGEKESIPEDLLNIFNKYEEISN